MNYKDAVNLADTVYWEDPGYEVEEARYLLRVAMNKAMYLDGEISLKLLKYNLEQLKIKFNIDAVPKE